MSFSCLFYFLDSPSIPSLAPCPPAPQLSLSGNPFTTSSHSTPANSSPRGPNPAHGLFLSIRVFYWHVATPAHFHITSGCSPHTVAEWSLTAEPGRPAEHSLYPTSFVSCTFRTPGLLGILSRIPSVACPPPSHPVTLCLSSFKRPLLIGRGV